jgi:DNA-binding transcriptional LysR family regulator
VGVLFQPIAWREPTETPRYARLGDRELVIALPTAHPLATLDRIPRRALLEETYVDWPDASWPELAIHARRQLFGTPDHPRRIEVLEAVDDSVIDLVRAGRGFASVAIPAPAPLPMPSEGVVHRRVEDPPPLIEYGVAWVEPNASSATAGFVGLAQTASEHPGRAEGSEPAGRSPARRRGA